ncbi:MAG TPA: hypothetical protein VGE34_01705 [Candidatus Saccharimonadales bacterium]
MTTIEQATERQTQTVLADVDSWEVCEELLELFGGDSDLFSKLEELEVEFSEDMFETLNCIAALKYDQTYGGEALDENGNAWLSGTLLGLMVVDNIASRKDVDPSSCRDSLLQSGLMAKFYREDDIKLEEIAGILSVIDDIGNKGLGNSGYSQLAAAVGLDVFNDTHTYDAFTKGYNFIIHRGRRALAAVWIANEFKRGIALLLDEGE